MSRSRKYCLLCASGLIAVVAVCFFCLREKEPSYNGRMLSQWLDDCLLDGITAGEADKAQRAVEHIGTNAMPILVEWSRATDSPIQKCLLTVADHLPNNRVGLYFAQSIRSRSADRKLSLASIGCSILRTNVSRNSN